MVLIVMVVLLLLLASGDTPAWLLWGWGLFALIFVLLAAWIAVETVADRLRTRNRRRTPRWDR